jgi:hypothetical protein
MPGPTHQGLLYLIKRCPDLAFTLARGFDEPIPHDYDKFEEAPNDLPEPSLQDNVMYADWVVAAVINAPRGRSARRLKPNRVAGLAIEVQTSDNASKYYSWLSYAAGVRRLFNCRGWTMVFAPDPVIRGNAQNMFVKEPRASPWFVDPDMLPPITQTQVALDNVHKAVLTAVFHAQSSEGLACARATLEALQQSSLASEERRIYHRLVTANLTDEQINQIPQEILDIDEVDPLGPMELTGAYYVRGHREGHEKGHQEGREEGLLLASRQFLRRVLQRRELEVDDDHRERIEACKDLTLLGLWHDRALTATALADVFDPPV